MTARTAKDVAAAVCAPLLALSGPALAAPSETPDVLASGLVGALGLAVANDGTAYVAEAFAGRLTAVAKDGTTRVVTRGPVGGVDVTGRGTLTVTLSASPESGMPTTFSVARVDQRGRQREIGSLIAHEEANNPDAVNTYGFVDGTRACLASAAPLGLGGYPGIVQSNPYKVLVHRSSRVVADAAANSIVRVSPRGRTGTGAVLPPGQDRLH